MTQAEAARPRLADAARRLLEEPWRKAAGKPSRAHLMAELRIALAYHDEAEARTVTAVPPDLEVLAECLAARDGRLFSVPVERDEYLEEAAELIGEYGRRTGALRPDGYHVGHEVCEDIATDAAMEKAYRETLETHLTHDHGCAHDFGEVANADGRLGSAVTAVPLSDEADVAVIDELRGSAVTAVPPTPMWFCGCLAKTTRTMCEGCPHPRHEGICDVPTNPVTGERLPAVTAVPLDTRGDDLRTLAGVILGGSSYKPHREAAERILAALGSAVTAVPPDLDR